jgi:phage terminase large subunit GpA-like protein
LTAESKVPVRNRRTNVTRYYWVKNQERNEALDLTVYAHAGLWLLQNKIDRQTYGDLFALHTEVMKGHSEPEPRTLSPRLISPGI